VARNELIVDFEDKKTGFELCDEITQSERIDLNIGRHSVWNRNLLDK